MKLIVLIYPCPMGQKDTEKRTKGTRGEPFVHRGCDTLHAHAREKTF